MNSLKKIAVVIPVLVVGLVFLGMHYLKQYQHATPKRLAALVTAILIFYAWVTIGIVRRRQDSFFDMLVQSAFYVYSFSVLTLTGYFILFNQVAAHNWWHKMVERVYRKDGVNLQPFLFLKRHQLLNYETVGNFIMLLPLGIFLPLMYKHAKGLAGVTGMAMLTSMTIELMQLATGVRIADIDDIILNTAGASCGFIVYFVIYRMFIKPFHTPRQIGAYT